MNKSLWSLLILALVVAKTGSAEPTLAETVIKLSQKVQRQVTNKVDQLPNEDLREIFHLLRSADRVLSTVPDKSPFQLSLNGAELTISCNGKLVTKWNHHDKYEIYGDVIALLDSQKEFAAYRCDGTAIVKQWKDVKEYLVTQDYIGLLDTNGIFDAYSLVTNKPIIDGWKDTIKIVLTSRYIALLDSNGIFQGYSTAGKEVIRQDNTKDIERVSETVIRYTLKSGQTAEFPIFQD